MPSIGDVANDAARLLYEYRLPVTLLTLVGLATVARIASKRGLVASARRHPSRTLVAIASIVAVVGPVGWYLGSPIFVRTSLVEAFPSPASVVAPDVGPASAALDARQDPTPTPSRRAPTPTPFAETTIAMGEWKGTDDFHFAKGSATIVEVEPGHYQLRLERFSIRNGPDLYVYLSPAADGWTEDALELGLLKATDGAFGYDLPPGTDPRRFRSAIVWCKAFSHLFATASFER